MSAQQPTVIFKEVPCSITSWAESALLARVLNKSLGQWGDLRSGSKVTQAQFLLFCTIVVKRQIDELKPEESGLTEKLKKAKGILEASKEFGSYIEAIEDEYLVAQGNFAALREQQSEILVRHEKDTKFQGPINVDEAPVNSTFINLLKAIASVMEARDYMWRYSKCSFRATWGKTVAKGQPSRKRKRVSEDEDEHVQVDEEGNWFTAITDGQLQDAASYRVKIIVECKRANRTTAVDMQETAQLIAWIRQYPSSERQRVIFSQTGKQIWISIARYSDGFLRYLNENEVKDTKLMRVDQFGPFDISSATEMKRVSGIILALHF